jgi:pyridoxal phosphate enzyme (YggS family)
MSVPDNVARVRERIARAAESAGRPSEDITLVAVTKYVRPEEAAQVVASGCLDLGESRPQELWHKAAALAAGGELAPPSGQAGPAVRWHLVGHLQRNKIRRTLPVVHMIHSVDSQRLLAAVDEELGRHETSRLAPLKVLLEVNTSGESAKHGLAPEELEGLLIYAPQGDRVTICGLMTIAALEGGPAVAARNFAALRKLRDNLQQVAPDGVRLDELSMGMSGDFEIAIAEGATIVRIGSALWDG